MIKKHIILLTGLLVACVCALPAQNIRGVVHGVSASGEKTPLPYATLHWANESTGANADENGRFTIAQPQNLPAQLVASFMGYASDTLAVTAASTSVEFVLYEGAQLSEVVVSGRQAGNYVSKLASVKTEIISAAGLCKMACCNLAESFENSASISVGYSDAVSGARQIRLLGLSGIYTQMLDENRADMRGLATPFGLSYTPGQWLESIQVAKGMGSVLQGYESITGQINLEYRKPTTPEPLFLNLYIDQLLRMEANVASSLQLSNRWSTTLLAHGSLDPKKYDGNHDGFLDEPLKKQINLSNRWLYMADNGTQLRFGLKGLYEQRNSGQMDFDKTRPRDTTSYGTEIENKRFGAYLKLGIPLNLHKAQETTEEGADEQSSNIAFMGDYTFHELNSFYGLKAYDGRQNTASLNVLLQSAFGQYHRYTVGLSGRWDDYRETLHDVWFTTSRQKDEALTRLNREEWVGGLFGEYTFAYQEKLTLVAGLRADYHNLYRWLVTPRMTVKYNFSDRLILRASGGRGFRTANVITDNIGMLATGRKIVIDDKLKIEDAWTFGGSLSWYFKLFQDENASVSVDYFHTNFTNQVIVDQERFLYEPAQNYSSIWIYNLNGKSYANTWQVDFSVEPLERFTVMATFRYTDSKTTYAYNQTRERPLTDRFKAVLNLQYATRMNIWTFDLTAQLNGQSRLPNFAVIDKEYSPVYPLFFAQVTRKFKGVDVYVGCENILDYMQENPVLSAGDPYSPAFNSSVIWGPLMGRRIYAGMRLTLFK